MDTANHPAQNADIVAIREGVKALCERFPGEYWRTKPTSACSCAKILSITSSGLSGCCAGVVGGNSWALMAAAKGRLAGAGGSCALVGGGACAFAVSGQAKSIRASSASRANVAKSGRTRNVETCKTLGLRITPPKLNLNNGAVIRSVPP